MSLKALDKQQQKVKKIGAGGSKPEIPEISPFKVTFDQKLYPSGTLYQVCEQRILPNGDVLTEKLHTQLLKDALTALEGYHVLGIVHGNLKKGNIKVKFSKKLGRYTVRLPDQSYSPAYSELNEDIYSLGFAFSLNEGRHPEPPKDTKLWGVWKMTLHNPLHRFQTAQEAKTFFTNL